MQAAEEGMPTTENEDDKCSSYGTEESEEEVFLEEEDNNGVDGIVDRMDEMKCNIAGIDATQNAIFDKLASLEKAIMRMQEDTTWVREELRVVHEVTENLADHVCMLSKQRTEEDALQQQRSPEVSAWGTWKDGGHTNVNDIAGITKNTEEAPVQLRDEEPSHIQKGKEAACSIRETKLCDMYSGMQGNITSWADDWGGAKL